MADTLLYLRHRAENTRRLKNNTRLPADWPGEDDLHKLATRAGGLFVWMTTAWGFIDSAHHPQKRLALLLESPHKAEVALDTLYKTALEYAGNWDDEDF